MTTIRRLAGLLAIAALVAACSSAGAASAPPTDPSATAPKPSATDRVIPGPNEPVSDVPGKPHVDPGPGGATLVTPKPGQLDIHPVSLDSIAASVDGRHVVLTAFWWSGVEPCNTLDTIVVAQGVGTFTITLREGHGPGEVACIDLAQLKATHIELGDLEPGTYTVADGGGGTATATFVVS
jgi:ABC-type transport system substrate-binding protein